MTSARLLLGVTAAARSCAMSRVNLAVPATRDKTPAPKPPASSPNKKSGTLTKKTKVRLGHAFMPMHGLCICAILGQGRSPGQVAVPQPQLLLGAEQSEGLGDRGLHAQDCPRRQRGAAQPKVTQLTHPSLIVLTNNIQLLSAESIFAMLTFWTGFIHLNLLSS